MTWDQIKSRMKQAKGQTRQKWGILTDDDLDIIADKREELIGGVRKYYGMEKKKAKRSASDFESNYR